MSLIRRQSSSFQVEPIYILVSKKATIVQAYVRAILIKVPEHEEPILVPKRMIKHGSVFAEPFELWVMKEFADANGIRGM